MDVGACVGGTHHFVTCSACLFLGSSDSGSGPGGGQGRHTVGLKSDGTVVARRIQ